jgi:hypothetical protein
MTIHWKALEEHFLMVPWENNPFSEFFSKNQFFKKSHKQQQENLAPTKFSSVFNFMSEKRQKNKNLIKMENRVAIYAITNLP